MSKRVKVIESIDTHKRAIKKLKKKLANMATTQHNQIYLLKPANHPGVLKLGRTNRPVLSRINGYAKGSELLFTMTCDRCDLIEQRLLKEFRDQFTWRKDIGREYFEGDQQRMLNIIVKHLANEFSPSCEEVIIDIISPDEELEFY